MYRLDALVGVYRIEVRGKIWCWSNFINIIDALKSASCKPFLLGNPEVKIDFCNLQGELLSIIYKLQFLLARFH